MALTIKVSDERAQQVDAHSRTRDTQSLPPSYYIGVYATGDLKFRGRAFSRENRLVREVHAFREAMVLFRYAGKILALR